MSLMCLHVLVLISLDRGLATSWRWGVLTDSCWGVRVFLSCDRSYELLPEYMLSLLAQPHTLLWGIRIGIPSAVLVLQRSIYGVLGWAVDLEKVGNKIIRLKSAADGAHWKQYCISDPSNWSCMPIRALPPSSLDVGDKDRPRGLVCTVRGQAVHLDMYAAFQGISGMTLPQMEQGMKFMGIELNSSKGST